VLLINNNKSAYRDTTPPIQFGYDVNANPNITSETGWTYVYDLSNQLIRVLQGANQVAGYTYTGAGQRIKKVTQTETRIFHYDLKGHLIAETNQTGQMLAEYVYLGDQLLAMIKPGEAVYYFHNDHLGTPQVLTNDSQAVAWKAVYTPFGEAVPSIQTIENPFRFPGQYYDRETGLHYNYFRYYNPPIGRYITPDPIGLEGGINLFGYAGANPIIFKDLFGLSSYYGYCRYYSGGRNIGIGAGQLRCKVWTMCRSDNTREVGEVIALFGGFTAGLLPAGVTMFNVSLDRQPYSSHPTLKDLSGGASISTFGFAAGPLGWSYTNLVLGMGEAEMTGWQAGIDASVDFFSGSSWLESPKTECCYDKPGTR